MQRSLVALRRLNAIGFIAGRSSGMVAFYSTPLAASVYFYSSSTGSNEGNSGNRRKNRNNDTVTRGFETKNIVRMTGVVASFMHRRGYGFLNDESTPPVRYFFTRSGLTGGGFYLEPGQRVTFLPFPASHRTLRNMGGGRADTNAEEDDTEESINEFLASQERSEGPDTGSTLPEKKEVLSMAKAIKLVNIDGEESIVTPILIRGVMDVWDPITATGVVAELDMNGEFHDDAPRFTLSSEDTDLHQRTTLNEKRLVQFCIYPDSPTVARRVILDLGAERRRSKRKGFTQSGPTYRKEDYSEEELGPLRIGTVRELRGQFGFVVDDATHHSIFFHTTALRGGSGDKNNNNNKKKGTSLRNPEVEEAAVSVVPGDVVTYYVLVQKAGKHLGKEVCVDVRIAGMKPSPVSAAIIPDGVTGGTVDAVKTAQAVRAASASASASAASASATVDEDVEDFESLFIDEPTAAATPQQQQQQPLSSSSPSSTPVAAFTDFVKNASSEELTATPPVQQQQHQKQEEQEETSVNSKQPNVNVNEKVETKDQQQPQQEEKGEGEEEGEEEDEDNHNEEDEDGDTEKDGLSTSSSSSSSSISSKSTTTAPKTAAAKKPATKKTGGKKGSQSARKKANQKRKGGSKKEKKSKTDNTHDDGEMTF